MGRLAVGRQRLGQEAMNRNATIVIDVAQATKFIQEIADTGACRADHLGERRLIRSVDDSAAPAPRAAIGERQKGSREALFAFPTADRLVPPEPAAKAATSNVPFSPGEAAGPSP